MPDAQTVARTSTNPTAANNEPEIREKLLDLDWLRLRLHEWRYNSSGTVWEFFTLLEISITKYLPKVVHGFKFSWYVVFLPDGYGLGCVLWLPG